MAEAKQYANRNRQGSDWFSHDPVKPASDNKMAGGGDQVKSSEMAQSAPVTGRAAPIKPVSNTNLWYKYDNPSNSTDTKAASASQKENNAVAAPVEAEPCVAAPVPAQESVQAPTEPMPASNTAADAEIASSVEVKSDDAKSKALKEGEKYCRRDRCGTSSDWFYHDKAAGQQASTGGVTRITSKEGGEIATKMKGESGNWFSHDNVEVAAPKTSRGKPPPQRNSDMKHIFHME